MSENLGITPSSVAKSFATAMGDLAREGGKGYIRQEVTSAGRTYVYDRNPSGKMDAKDIVQVANKIAQDALSVSGEALTGEELKNIETGMEKLQGRLSAHAEKLERSWFKNIFVRIDYTALVNELTLPNYQKELTDKLAGATFSQFLPINRDDLMKYSEKIIRDFLDFKKDISLDEAKNKFLEEFLLEKYPEFKALEGLIGKEEFMKLVNENKDLKEIINHISNDKLVGDKTSLQLQFNAIILEVHTKVMDYADQTRDSSYRERFGNFQLKKSEQVFPKEEERIDAETISKSSVLPSDEPTTIKEGAAGNHSVGETNQQRVKGPSKGSVEELPQQNEDDRSARSTQGKSNLAKQRWSTAKS